MKGRAKFLVLVCGWALLTSAWVIGNPSFEAPDEGDHYVRTIGLADGEVVGGPAPDANIGITPRQVAWTRQATRAVLVPAGKSPPVCSADPRAPVNCPTQADGRTEAIERVTPVGTYQPLPYLAPAAVINLTDDPTESLRWSRAAGALVALILLAVAVALLWAPPRIESLLGLIVAVTPMVLFCVASLNGSGLEIASSLAFLAGVLRVSRSEATPGWAWVSTGLAGGVLAASRSPGPGWVLFGLILALALIGLRGSWRRVSAAGGPAYAAGALIAIGLLANRSWEATYGPDAPLATHALRAGLDVGLTQWWQASVDLVGKFGYREYQLPLWIPLFWGLVLLVLGVLAWRVSGKRDRWVLGAIAAAAVTVPYLLYVFVNRDTGFGLQGRHVIPIVAALPLLAGELLYRRNVRVSGRGLLGLTGLIGFLQAAAFYFNGRRYAVGSDGPLYFIGDARWSPPLGWWVILGIATLGGFAIATIGLGEWRDGKGEAAGDP